MLKRDYTKSGINYINQNKIPLIIISALLVLGIIIAVIFGFEGNFEFKGYNEFSVNASTLNSSNYNKYSNQISSIVNENGGKFDTISVFDEGDEVKLVVRYSKSVSEEKQLAINEKIADKFEIEITKISSHVKVKPIVKVTDYVYTATAILILIVIASIFAYIRYNGASAISMIISCLLGSLGYMAISAIIRLKIGMSYFAMLVILNMLIIYFAVNIFEHMHKSGWLANDDYNSAIKESLKASRFRMCFMSIATMVIGVLFVILAPKALKYVSLNILYIAFVSLAVACYVVPFVWSLFIDKCKKREVKVKTSNIENENK